jgi:hypothetical protein
MLEKYAQSRVGRVLGILVLMAAVLGGGAWGLEGSHARGAVASGLAQDAGARGVSLLAEQLEAHAAGGGFVLVEGPEGEIVCREATPEEAAWMRRRDPTVPLHVISPLRTNQQQTGLRIILRATPQLKQFPQAEAAFLRAAQTWERLIRNPITIVLDVDFGPTRFGQPYPPGVIGSTGPQLIGNQNGYPDVRTQLLRGASPQETAVYNALPQGQVPTDLGPTAAVVAPSAVLRALGVDPPRRRSGWRALAVRRSPLHRVQLECAL